MCTCFKFIFRLYFLHGRKSWSYKCCAELGTKWHQIHRVITGNKSPQRTVTHEKEADVTFIHEHGGAYVTVSHSLSMSHNEVERTSGNHQGQLERVAEGSVQSGFDHLHWWRLHNLPGQPIPVSDHSHCKNIFFVCSNGICCTSVCVHCPLSCHWTDSWLVCACSRLPHESQRLRIPEGKLY